MVTIEQWKASGAPYDEGVQLYASLQGHNKVLLKNFQRKYSAQLHDKLKYELSKLDKSAKTVKNVQKQLKKEQNGTFEPKRNKTEQNETKRYKTEVVQYIEQQTEATEKKNAIFFHDLPQELRGVYLNATQLFREMCLLKVQLNELPEEAENTALDIQIQINNKRKENAQLWAKIDYWQTHRTLPKQAKGQFEDLSAANLVKQEQYKFAAISKLKKRLEENRKNLEKASSIAEINRLQRAIAKQESNIIKKNDELLTIKRLINE